MLYGRRYGIGICKQSVMMVMVVIFIPGWMHYAR